MSTQPPQLSGEEKHSNRVFWQDQINKWKESTLTITEYCRNHKLSIDQFKYWQYRFAPEMIKSRKLKKPFFTKVQIAQSKVFDNSIENANANFQLTVRDVQLQIPPQFDTLALKRLLDCLGVK